MTTNNETPNPGTPPADVEALVDRLSDCLGDDPPAYIEQPIDDAIAALRTLSADNARLAARVAELDEALEYEQVIADPYKAEPSEEDGWWVCVMPGVEGCVGPFGTEDEAQAKADEMNAPFRCKFQRQLALAAKAERAKCVAELRALVGERPADPNTGNSQVPPLEDPIHAICAIEAWDAITGAADYLEANGRDETNG